MHPSVVEFWADFAAGPPPFVHPRDRGVFERWAPEFLRHQVVTYRTYGYDQEAQNKGFVHLSLLPAPYVGDVDNADIVVLMLNPGFLPLDYLAEEQMDFRLSALVNLKQNFEHIQYRYQFLNPQFSWHGGYQWIMRKLGSLPEEVARQQARSVESVIAELANRMVVFELFPYHSVNFSSSRLLGALPSVKAVREFILNSIIPRARDCQEITLVAARAWRKVGLNLADDNGRNLIVYSRPGEAQGAKLNPSSRGGRAILERLLQPQPVSGPPSCTRL